MTPTQALEAVERLDAEATPALKWTPLPMPIRYPDLAPQCSVSCPWYKYNPTGCAHPEGNREDDTCHPAMMLDALTCVGMERARDSWKRRVRELEAALAAEVERRVSAEAIAERGASIAGNTGSVSSMWQAHRSRWPEGE